MKKTLRIALAAALWLALPTTTTLAKSPELTPERILQHLRSPEKKLVIVDTDAFNEMDDQYAIAYALASNQMEVLALNAAPYKDYQNDGDDAWQTGMEKSYNEIERVLGIMGLTGKVPVFRGSPTRVSDAPGFGPVDSPAARNIVKIARKAKSPVYVMCLGAITNVASAIMIDPSIKSKIVVVYVGLNCLDATVAAEYNTRGDMRAVQQVLNSGVPLVVLPASGNVEKGTQVLSVDQEEVKAIKSETPIARFLRSDLPHTFKQTTGNWWHILWDIAAPALIAVPDAFQLEAMPAPVLTDSSLYAFDSTRPRILWMHSLEPKAVRRSCFAAISAWGKPR